MFQVCGQAAVEDREWIKLGVGGGCGGRYEGMKVGGESSRGGRGGRGETGEPPMGEDGRGCFAGCGPQSVKVGG